MRSNNTMQTSEKTIVQEKTHIIELEENYYSAKKCYEESPKDPRLNYYFKYYRREYVKALVEENKRNAEKHHGITHCQ